MSLESFSDTILTGLKFSEKRGWYPTEKGMAAVTKTLKEAHAEGTFGAHARELIKVMGFLHQRGQADLVFQAYSELSKVFESEISASVSEHAEDHRKQQSLAAQWLGAAAPKAAHIDAPKEGLSLSQIAPPGALRDPRAFGRKKPKNPKK